MCIILPVDHIPCSHSVAIWQHCVKAPRSAQGRKPCSRIRQHARPILTRKLCVHCGGPRYFTRRGGIAERGSGSPTVANRGEGKDDYSESYDSGYHSDVIHEEDEDEDAVMSPTTARVSARRPRDVAQKRSLSRPRSPNSRRPSWRPNLKREMSAEHASYRDQSIDSTMSDFEERWDISAATRYTTSEFTGERSVSPMLSRPQARRKSSTLLHPSSPTPEPADETHSERSVSFMDLTPPSSPEPRPFFLRKDSSLLHPSTPDMEPDTALANPKPFSFNFSLPLLSQRQQPPTFVPESPPRRPGVSPRKNSTLLHPSSPPDSPSTAAAPFILPIHAKTILSLPPTPQATPTTDTFQLRRSESLKRTSRSDIEWNQPFHSSHSDGEDDSDDGGSEGECKTFGEKAVLARTGRMARASRISLFSDGNALKILQDL